MTAARPVLVLRRGGLGDTLLLAPLLAALRRSHPGRELHIAGVLEFVEVLAAWGACDVAMSGEDLPLWSPERLGDRLAAYATVIGDEPVANVRLRPQHVEPGVPFGLQLARQAGLQPRWPADAWLRPARGRQPEGALVLAPGSGDRAKCWPRERWLELAGMVAGAVQVVVGPAEVERDDPQRWPWPVEVSFLVGLQPVELGRRLLAARGYVGNDSGTTHLSAVLGVPTVALFGPTDPAVWAPVGEHVRVVGALGRALASVTAAEVAARVE